MKSSRKDGGTLKKKLSNFLLAYRTTPHTTTNETPAHLLMGRTLQTRLSRIKPDLSQTVRRKQENMSNQKGSIREFEKGERVQVRDYRQNSDKWVPGTILSKTGPLSYRVDVGPGSTWRRHTDQLVKSDLPRTESIIDVPTTSPWKSKDKSHSPVVVVQRPTLSNPDQVPTPVPTTVPATAPVLPATTPQRRYPIRSTRNKAPVKLDW